MGGSESVDFLAPSGSGENTLVTCENGDFAADLEVAHAVPRAPAFPPRLDAPEEIETPGDRTIEALAELSRHRRGRDVEGDAGDEGGRHRRARARARRRPAREGEADRRARRKRPPVDGGRDPRGVRRRPRLARPGRLRAARSSPTRRCAKGSSSPARTAPAGISAASRPAATSRRASPTSASRRRATACALRRRAARSRPRSRSATSSSSARATRCRSNATFLDEDGRGEAARDGQLRHRPRRGSWPPPSSKVTTRTGSAGPPRSRRTTSTSSCCRAWKQQAEEAARTLSARGCDVLLDDRELRPGREVRRRRPDRPADARHGRQEDARGRDGRRARPA